MYDGDYDYQYAAPPKSPIPAAIVTSLVTTVAVFFGLRILDDRGLVPGNRKAGEVAAVEVPSVLGLAPDQARTLLRGRDLLMSVEAERNDPKFSAGTISAQTPQAGSRVPRAADVLVVVSRGLGQTVVPPVVGLRVEDAVKEIAAKALQIAPQQKTASSETVVAGAVSASDPVAGTSVPPQSMVTLVVSTGPSGRSVPRVVGMKLPKAKTLLEGAGFKVGKTRFDYDERFGGYVILKQDPVENATAVLGSEIALVVNEPN